MEALPDPRDEEIERLQRRVSELVTVNAALERENAESLRTRRSLRASESSSRALIDGVPGLVAVLGPDGGVLSVNGEIVEYTGRGLDELRQWGSNGTVHDEDLPHVAEVFGGSIANGEPYEIEQRLRRYDGEYRWFRNRGAPVRDASGRVTSWYVLLTDIDDLKRAEAALRERERSLRSIIDGIPGFIAISSPEGELLVANRQMTEYFGATIEELKSWDEYVHEADRPRAFEQLATSIASGVPFDVEHRLRRADGTYRWFSSRGLPIRDASEGIANWYFLLADIDDLKRAEEALKSRERDLLLIVDSIPGQIAVFTPEGKVEVVNRQVLEYFGRTLEDLRQWEISDAVHPDDRAGILERFTQAIASGEPFIWENRARRFDGEYRWLQTCGYPLKDENGHVVRWYNLLIDIDERKRAEAELQRAYESFADAQRISHTGSFTTDLVADDHNWSDESYRIFDFEPGTRITVQRVREIVHLDDLATFDALIERGVGGEDVEFDFRIVTAQGALKHVHALAHVVEKVAGKPVFVGALQDVTKSKLAEEQIRRSEAFLADGQRLSQTGSFSWRTDTDELLFSDELRRIFEIEPTIPLTFELILSRVHRMDVALVQEKIGHARGGGEDLDYEVRLQMPDGRVKHIQTFAHAVVDGGQLEVVGAMLDITQRRHSEEALEKARSELADVTRAMSLGVLTASIAHEVNQPLSGILTNAGTCLRMLGAQPPNLGGALETARRTIRDANRASEVIARLRELFGKKEPAAEAVDLNDVVREVIALSSNELQRRRIALLTTFDDELPLATGDRVQLQQVILNLILNASDAMQGVDDRPREIVIETARDEPGAARVTVRDTGVGLPPDSLDKLFDAFYTTKADGMGIGLSVSRSIIERHNGRLWAERNDGPGATFSFAIPYGPAESDLARAAEAPDAPDVGAGP
jgi:PAS domain S-box-containing protein